MSTISASTTSTTAYKVTADTTGTLVFQTGATPTTALTIGSDQSVTFAGTPTYSGGTANGILYLNGSKAITSGSALVFDGTNFGVGVTPSAWQSGFKAIQLSGLASWNVDGSTAGSATYFGNNVYRDSADSRWEYIASGDNATQYLQASGQHIWRTAASGTANNAITFTQAMTLNANGVLALQGASTSANGVGITFPATQSASSDVNTLDDYEEGTWTPSFTSVGASFTYPRGQYGSYIKIGSLVYAQFYIGADATGTTSNANQITGFPFASANLGSLAQASATAWVSQTQALGFTMDNNSTLITMWKQNAGSATTATAAQTVGGYIVGIAVYRAST